MRILAFDPGSRNLGWAVIEMNASNIHRIDSGQSHNSDLSETLKMVLSLTEWWCRSECVAIEKSVPPKARSLQWEETAQVRGAIKAFVVGIPVIELTAKQVRAKLGISGGTKLGISEDRRMRDAVKKIFGYEPKGSHETDALALAWAVAMEKS